VAACLLKDMTNIGAHLRFQVRGSSEFSGRYGVTDTLGPPHSNGLLLDDLTREEADQIVYILNQHRLGEVGAKTRLQ